MSLSKDDDDDDDDDGPIPSGENGSNHHHHHPSIKTTNTTTTTTTTNKKKKKYKSEKSVRFLFREATKARNEHAAKYNNKNNNNNKTTTGVVALEYEEDEEEEDEEEEKIILEEVSDTTEKAFLDAGTTRRQKRRKDRVLPATQRADDSNTFPMMGIPVAFPKGLTPLVPQKIVMSKVLQALKTKTHALVESPTGTGKSLALLCASLAFQKEMRRKSREKRTKVGTTPENKGLPEGWRTANGMFARDDEDEEKKDDVVKVENNTNDDESKKTTQQQQTTMKTTPMGEKLGVEKEEEEEEEEVPRIFLCSRTHSQIAQLSKELKRCPYRPNFSVLGSRQQFCPAKKTDEECQEMTRGCVKPNASRAQEKDPVESKCAYFNRQSHLLDEMRNAHIWDIEDLKYAADEHEACTFYVTKELYKNAEFVLCPYNYIFDGAIRAAMDIDLHNAAIIIDEGHNIEDVCREGASVEVYQKDVTRYLDEIGILVGHFPEALPVKNFLNEISAWISRKMKQRDKFDRYNKTRTITDSNVIIEELWDALCNPKREQETLDSVLGEIHQLTSKQSRLMQSISDRGEKVTGVLGMQAMRFANEIATKISLFKQYSNDYVLCIAQFAHDAFNNPDKPKHDEMTGGFALWCLRPAVAFERVAEEARCVILTSGTLSPTSSLEGELGVPFPIKVDAPHVVPNNQIFVESLDTLGAITRKNLQACGQQDFSARLGDMLLRYCKHIPGGVLVFLPSYELIQRISDEWFHTTGHHSQISKHKKIVFETGGSRGFDETIEDFNDGLKKKGSLLFAVFRGKCSEGLDFKDNRARAVFCVGIPFPNLGDVKVQIKKQFNSSPHGRYKHLLDGSRWYEHQAFRAYNQALGRCVRHLHDYAAIFLVDQRFCHNREYTNLISKWVRGRVRTSGGANESVGMLSEFFEMLEANPPSSSSGTKTTTK